MPFEIDTNKPNDLESNQNRINENELYDQNNSRQSKVNERSFIYINQKFRSPALSQLYSPNDFLADTISVIGNERTIHHYSEGNPIKPLYSRNSHLATKVKNREPSRSLYFTDENQDSLKVVPPVIDKINTFSDVFHTSANNIANSETTQYIELLKPPILRSSNYVNSMERMSWQGNQPKVAKHYDQNKKQKNGHAIIPSPSYFEKTSVNYGYHNYGFPSSHGEGSQKKTKEIEVFRRLNYQISDNSEAAIKLGDKNVVTDVILRKLLDDNAEVSKILQKYVKDSRTNSVSNKGLNLKVNCNHSDCITESKVQYVNQLSAKSNCRCDHHRLNVTIKGLNGFEMDITTKKDIMTTDPYSLSKSSEIVDYGDFIMDDMNIEKTVRELVQ
ncbi:unnamed protein product [Chilo suppressalis]|uniref:Uncharacterized protein n=1 Tax=Chilo suppressalis TaxID=168631 RepID=A0ABN8AY52_CHISP|nr:unnamed protein product [Chilo suppressalis]